MRDPSPYSVAERRRLLVTQASAALQGHVVALWRLEENGETVAEAVSRPDVPADTFDFDLARLLKRWGRAARPGSLWVGCRIDADRWCVGLVRSDPPCPPPNGVERRSPEQLIVELAGLSIGALERLWAATSDQATVYLCTALEQLKMCLLRVHAVPGLTQSARARLLSDLAGVTVHIDNALVA
ncbi:MAG TPA: hypothetical protein VGU74_08120 [Gemmatimonadales bacterium]|nr:hypothetical protein [Gemmatimonadales bacterium]